MAQIKHLNDQNNTRFYPVTHVKAVVGLKEVEFAIKVSEEELLTLINTSSLEPGQCYYISGFTTQINEDNPVISQQHKIDLYLSALGKSQISNKAYAAYNTDGTDNYYKDLNIPVDKWDIEVSFTGNNLNIIKDIKIKIDSSLDIYTGYNTIIAHNGVDTLIVACNKSNAVSISKDEGLSFYQRELPHTYTDIQGLIYGIGQFILFDSEGYISVSNDDGESWQLISDYLYSNIAGQYNITTRLSGYTSACVGDNEIIIVGNGVGIRSADCYNWTSFKHNGFDGGWYKPQVAAGDNKIVITCYNTGGLISSIDNGSTWSRNEPFNTYWSGVAFGNHTFAIIAGNRRSAVIRNTDTITNITWEDGTHIYDSPNLNRDPGKVCFNNNTFYCFSAYRESNLYSYSDDGLNWNAVYFPKNVYVGYYGSNTPTFGANGEMYFVNSLDRSIWRNPTPKQGDTWEQLIVPTEIHLYDNIISNGTNYLLIPQEKEFCIRYDNTIEYTRFKNSMKCEAVVYTGDQYEGIFLNSENSSYNIALSDNGIDWQYFDFAEPGLSKCKAFTLNPNTKDILCIFDTGNKYIINSYQYKLLESGSSTLSDVKCIYNQFLNKFVVIEQLQNTNSTQAQILNITFDDFSKEVYSLPSQMYVTDLNTSYYNIYLSGYNISNNEEYYTYKISTRDLQSELLSLNGYITNSIESDVGIFATTNTYTSYVIQNSKCLDLQLEIEKLYLSNGNIILAKVVDIQEIVRINYIPHHNLTISKLTDEYNNTCNFDFKNLCKVNVNNTTNYLFDQDGLDVSTTGFVKNFTQVNGNDSLIKYTMFDIYSPLYDCTVIENTKGIFTIGSIVSNLHFKNVTTCDFKTVSLNLSTTKDKELWKTNRTIYLQEACGDILYYTQNNGITWNVKNSNVSLEGYATEEFVTSQGYLTEVPENIITEETLSQKNYTTQTQVQDYVNESLTDYITVDDLSDYGFLQEVPSEYVTDGELEEMGYATEAWVQGKGYLTEHQDISNLATKDEIPSLDEYIKSEDVGSIDIKTLADSENLKQSWSNKQDKIEDLDIIRTGSNLGNTALQETSEVIRNLETQIQDVSKMKDSIGFNNNITVSFSGTNNLDECTTLIEAILKLDSLLINQTT